MDIDRRRFLGILGGSAAALVLPTGDADAASPIRRLGTVAIRRGSTGSSRKLALAARPAGGFAAFFEQEPGSGPAPSSYARFFAADRTPLGPSRLGCDETVSVFGERPGSVGSVVMNADGTGSLFMAGRRAADPRKTLWWMQRVGRTGAPIGRPIRLGAGTTGVDNHAVRLSNGNLLCCWQDFGVPSTVARVMTPAGRSLAFAGRDLVPARVRAIAAMPSGSRAILGYNLPGGRIGLQVVSARLARVGAEIVFAADESEGGLALASHPRGAAAFWKIRDPATGLLFMTGALIGTDGTVLMRYRRQPLRSNPDEDPTQDFHPVAVCLPDGRVVVAFDSLKRLPTGSVNRAYQVIACLFGGDGRRIGTPLVVYEQRAAFEFFYYRNFPTALVRLKDRSLLLGIDTGYLTETHTALAVRLSVS